MGRRRKEFHEDSLADEIERVWGRNSDHYKVYQKLLEERDRLKLENITLKGLPNK